MVSKNEIGMSIKELKTSNEKTGVEQIQAYFKAHKDKAFRCCEIEKLFIKILSKYAVRGAIKRTFDLGLLKKRQFCNNKTFYYWSGDKKEETIKEKQWSKPRKPIKVDFMKNIKK